MTDSSHLNKKKKRKKKKKKQICNMLVTGGAGFIGSAFVRYILNSEQWHTKSRNSSKTSLDTNGEINGAPGMYDTHGNGHNDNMCDALQVEEEEEGEEEEEEGEKEEERKNVNNDDTVCTDAEECSKEASVQVSTSARVIVLDRLSYCSTRNNIEPLLEVYRKRLTFIHGDVRDMELVMRILQEYDIDCVVHFAAETHVENSFEDSLQFTSSNIVGTHTLLECCRLHTSRQQYSSQNYCEYYHSKVDELKVESPPPITKITRFFHVSTDEVYGETDTRNDALPSVEGDKMNPSTPYAATKAAAELIAQSYHKTFGLNLIMTRCNNVYGPRQYPEKLVPKFILRRMDGQSMPIHGDGKQRRSYLYVDDVAEACWRLLERGIVGEMYNIGSDRERTVISVANDIARTVALYQSQPPLDNGNCGNRGQNDNNNCIDADADADADADDKTNGSEIQIQFVKDRLRNDRRYFLDSTKLLQLGWSPRTTWDDGLKATVAWYCKHDCFEHWKGCDVKKALSTLPSAL